MKVGIGILYCTMIMKKNVFQNTALNYRNSMFAAIKKKKKKIFSKLGIGGGRNFSSKGTKILKFHVKYL